MNTYRKIAIIAGVLFIIGTAAGVLSAVFTAPIINTQDYLVKISTNADQLIIGALFEYIMAAACAGIAISLYPVLRKYNEGLALGSVGFRLIEGVIGIVGVISLLLLEPLSREFIKAGIPNQSYFQTLGVLLKAGHELCTPLAGKLAWCIGALMYYSIFYQSKLIPRWLSGWGIIGIILAIAASIPFMFHLTDSYSTIDTVLHLPIGLQEIVLAIWLIVKGFNPSAFVNIKQI